jgi:hypothetical protein
MFNPAKLQQLSETPGIEAVVVRRPSARVDFGAAKWHTFLAGAIDLLALTDETALRLIVGKHTITVQRSGEETIAVVLPTGHPIAKSLHRIIRRAARKEKT